MAKFIKEIYIARPWYHDFSAIGVQTNFANYLPVKVKLQNFVLSLFRRKVDIFNLRGEFYVKNQKDKETYIIPYLTKAFFLSKSRNLTFKTLFCADGYYSFWVKKFFNPLKIIGMDWNEEDIKRCLLMKRILEFSGMEFVQKDIYGLSDSEQFDIVLNAGGLYHIAQPEKLLKLCFRITKNI